MGKLNNNNKGKGLITKKEIAQQPEVWEKTYDIIFSMKIDIENFLMKIKIEKDVDIILTGAGTSSIVGGTVCGLLGKHQKLPSRAIPTTDLITYPDFFLLKNKPTLLVSFARSGNSPESVAAVDIVNNYCDKAYHLIITCNESGALMKKTGSENMLKILLPSETNDKGLAMTSSFTSMMLAFILIAKIDSLEKEQAMVQQLADWGNIILNKYKNIIETFASTDFKRAFFVGSGPLRGIAEESHLKLQELTDGEIMCAYNSFLGFRHGPRAVVNKDTLLIYLLADDDNTRKYEYDLIKQVNSGSKGLAQVVISHKPIIIEGVKFDLDICFGTKDAPEADIEYLSVVEVMFAQLIGYYKSLSLGLDPDKPSVSGSLTRVVEGVIVHNLKF